MRRKMPRLWTSPQQNQIMVGFIEQYGDRGHIDTPGRDMPPRRWRELVEKLNSCSKGDARPAEKWKKVWSDFKANTKKKAARINKAATDTGGDSSGEAGELTEMEERVLAIINPAAASGSDVPKDDQDKFWADKKCNIRRLATVHGNPDTGTPPPGFSPVDKKILSMVGFRDGGTSCMRSSFSKFRKVKREKPANDFEDEQSMDFDQMDKPIEFVDHPVENDEERHTAQMDKLFQVMTDQAAALTELAQASHSTALALERLAESSQRQASATERLADSVQRIADALVAKCSVNVGTDNQKVYGDIQS